MAVSDLSLDPTQPLNYVALATQTEGYSATDLRDLVSRAVHQAAIRLLGNSPDRSVRSQITFSSHCTVLTSADLLRFRFRFGARTLQVHMLASRLYRCGTSNSKNPKLNGPILVAYMRHAVCCERHSNGQLNTGPFSRSVLFDCDPGTLSLDSLAVAYDC